MKLSIRQKGLLTGRALAGALIGALMTLVGSLILVVVGECLKWVMDGSADDRMPRSAIVLLAAGAIVGAIWGAILNVEEDL